MPTSPLPFHPLSRSPSPARRFLHFESWLRRFDGRWFQLDFNPTGLASVECLVRFQRGRQRFALQYNGGEILYDIPTTLKTLGYLDNRKDGELVDAVIEFKKWLQRLISSSRSACADTVHVKSFEELPLQLP